MENTLRGGRWEVGVEVSRLRYLPDIQIDARWHWLYEYGIQGTGIGWMLKCWVPSYT